MRERALFSTMFGLGVGAVIVGVTVSRLVVGPAVENGAETPPAAAAETASAAVSSAAQPQRQHRVRPRKHRRPAVIEPVPAASAPSPEAETPIAAASPAEAEGAPIAIVRGGVAAATRGSRARGARIIQIDPDTGER
jgi:hypothetical protein